LADELRSAVGIEATLVPGSGGAFEVTVDGKLIFSKLQIRRFPDPGEILGKIKN
jgi:selenoprotein W-related protein